MTRRPRLLPGVLCAAALALTSFGITAPALAAGPGDPGDAGEVRRQMLERAAAQPGTTASLVSSRNIAQVDSDPGQVGISGCFTATAPLFVTSGLDSLRVFDVSDPPDPSSPACCPA
ncbi:hypothetical protein [Nocardioides salarius]|uniref:hypothetical protein n=1 Tax=Nocardioides salarius TaxID=374513 RepID=UPI0030F56725